MRERELHRTVEILRDLAMATPEGRAAFTQAEAVSDPLHVGDVVRFKATGMVAKVARFAHDGTTDFWADNETGPYKQADVERLAGR